MGTRSLTFVYDDNNTPLINLYRQYDGHPRGHGAELAGFLSGFEVGNGIPGNVPAKYANGAGCLAAQLVAHFKGSGPGQFYLYPTDCLDAGQDYEYHVRVSHDGIHVSIVAALTDSVSIVDCGCSVFEGAVTDLVEFCKQKETA